MSDGERDRTRMGGPRARPDRSAQHSDELRDAIRRLERRAPASPPSNLADVRATGDRGSGTPDMWSDTGTILVIDPQQAERQTARFSGRPAARPSRASRSAPPTNAPDVRGVSPPSRSLPPIVPGGAQHGAVAAPTAARREEHRENGDRYGVRPRYVPWSHQAIGATRYAAQRRERAEEQARERARRRGRVFNPATIPPEELRQQERWVRQVMGGWGPEEFAALELSFTALDDESATYAWTFYVWVWVLLSRSQPRRMDAIRKRLHQIRWEEEQRRVQQREFRVDRNPPPDPYDPLGLRLHAPDPFAGLNTLDASALGSLSYALARMLGADNETALRVAEAEAAVGELAPAVAGAIALLKARRARAARAAGGSGGTPPAGGGAPPAVAPELVGENAHPLGETARTGGIRRIRVRRDSDGTQTVTIDGTLLPPLDRADRATPNFNRRWAALDLPGYHIAHLWGPGFGDEAFDGMMYAPRAVNQVFQGAIESRLRELQSLASQQGATIELTARAVSYPLSTFRGQQLLKQASYHFEVRFPDGSSQLIGEVDIEVPRPGARGGPVTEVTGGSSGVWSLQ